MTRKGQEKGVGGGEKGVKNRSYEEMEEKCVRRQYEWRNSGEK